MPVENSRGEIRPQLAIGMPVYNGGRWLEESIDSILSQSVTNFELLIADNASTDDTETICRRYAEIDSRVRYHRHAYNRGALKNYNDVFGMTASKYFKWASCSDHCKPTFFERCIEVLESRDDVVLAYPQTMLFSSDTGQECLFYQNLMLEDQAASQRIGIALDWLEGLNCAYNGIFRRSALEKIMPYKEVRSYDINLMLEMSLHGKFVEIAKPLFHRRFDPESTGILLNQRDRVSFFGAYKMEFGRLQWTMREMDRLAMPFRAPISFAEKLRIERELLGRLVWRLPSLLRKSITLLKRVWSKVINI